MNFPKLRSLEAFPITLEEKRYICLRDPMQITDKILYLPFPAFLLVSLFDGSRSLEQIQLAYKTHIQQPITIAEIEEVIKALDEHLFMQSETFEEKYREMVRAFQEAPVRPAFLAGKSYTLDREEALKWMDGLFDGNGHRPPEENVEPGDPIRGIVVPHYDLRFAASSYSLAYQHLRDTEAETFVILGTGHHLLNDFFSCLDKDFETPLGTSRTDRDFLRRLEEGFGESIYPDILVHRMEHTIEFQVLFLQYLFQDKKNYKIVPILISFPEFIGEMDHEKFNQKRLDRFFGALSRAIAESKGKVCVIASVDFSHVGQRFGDNSAMDKEFLERIETDDRRLLSHLGKMEFDGFLQSVKETNPKNRVCGYPALHTLMKTLGARRGTLLEYRQNVERDANSMVSFASMLIH
jgi:AmmeMemoRadiSam system protein B